MLLIREVQGSLLKYANERGYWIVSPYNSIQVSSLKSSLYNHFWNTLLQGLLAWQYAQQDYTYMYLVRWCGNSLRGMNLNIDSYSATNNINKEFSICYCFSASS